MEAMCSSETPVSTRAHGDISLKTTFFIVKDTVRKSVFSATQSGLHNKDQKRIVDNFFKLIPFFTLTDI
jgi:hypothetical protein